MAEPEQDFGQLLETMKRSAGALREADVPFVLGGGLACWARGAPKTEHDVDFLVRPRDAERAQQALAAAGMRTEKPPEAWLRRRTTVTCSSTSSSTRRVDQSATSSSIGPRISRSMRR